MIKWDNVEEPQYLYLICRVGVYTFRIEYCVENGAYYLSLGSSGQTVCLYSMDKEELICRANAEIKKWLELEYGRFNEKLEKVAAENRNLEAAIKELM